MIWRTAMLLWRSKYGDGMTLPYLTWVDATIQGYKPSLEYAKRLMKIMASISCTDSMLDYENPNDTVFLRAEDPDWSEDGIARHGERELPRVVHAWHCGRVDAMVFGYYHKRDGEHFCYDNMETSYRNYADEDGRLTAEQYFHKDLDRSYAAIRKGWFSRYVIPEDEAIDADKCGRWRSPKPETDGPFLIEVEKLCQLKTKK